MKKIISFTLCFLVCFCLVGCSPEEKRTINGHEMGVVINKETYTLPTKASDLVDKGFLLNNMNFSSESGEDYLFNGTSTTPEFMIKYKFQKGAELTYKNCTITGITTDYYGNRTTIKTPEGLGLGSSLKKVKKIYGKPSININNEIYVYLDDSKEYCYVFESDLFYYGTITKAEIENYQNLAE